VRVAALLAVGLVLSGCAVGGSKTTTVTVTRTVTSPVKTPAVQAETAYVKYFGKPVSVTKLDAKRYAFTITPKFFLVGVTANVAFAAEQQNACQPLECPPVDNDYLVLPAGSQPLLFILPAKATGTVLTSSTEPTKITAKQLSALLGGAPTPTLYEPLESVWVTVNGDTVTSFAQQYQP
jgi:hypothetical protein